MIVAMAGGGGRACSVVNATPGKHVQVTGGLCLAGTTCLGNRTLLDFNEITLDGKGRAGAACRRRA